jgi:hypothetical protein
MWTNSSPFSPKAIGLAACGPAGGSEDGIEVPARADRDVPRAADVVGNDTGAEALRQRQAAVALIAGTRPVLLLRDHSGAGRGHQDRNDCSSHVTHLQ